MRRAEQLKEPVRQAITPLVAGKYAEFATLTHGVRLKAKMGQPIEATAITNVHLAARMKKNNHSSLSRAVLLILAFCATPVLLLSCGKLLSGYVNFTQQSQAYYASIALACSGLLSQTNQTSGERVIKGDDKSLPKVLLDLHATKIKVAKHLLIETNDMSGVTIIFGEGRPEHVVGWWQRDYGNGNRPWELSVNGDGPSTVVFSTKVPPPIQGTKSAN